ncbi:MAG TPA: hypothetical protein VN722_01820 [Hanamia sp.]|nr:hypothetical protein [Hanamia sp.]
MKRFLEFFLGIILILLILGKYGDKNHHQQPLVSYLSTNLFLEIVIYIVLIFFAFKFIGGKKKDYSKFFYNLLVKLFGDPEKRKG